MPAFNKGKANDYVFVSATLKAMVMLPAYVFDADADFVANISASEFVDASYARQTLAGKSVVIDDASDQAEHLSSDVVLASLDGGDFSGLVLYREVTNDADSVPVHWLPNTTGTKVANGGDVTFSCPADGWFQGT